MAKLSYFAPFNSPNSPHMTRILCNPSELMCEIDSRCFKGAEKICFWKSATFSQSPPTPSMWWDHLNQLYISLWCLKTICKEVLKYYDNAKTVKMKACMIFSMRAKWLRCERKRDWTANRGGPYFIEIVQWPKPPVQSMETHIRTREKSTGALLLTKWPPV